MSAQCDSAFSQLTGRDRRHGRPRPGHDGGSAAVIRLSQRTERAY